MSERRALMGAGAAHLALLGVMSFGWAAMQRPIAPPPDAVAVDLTEIAEVATASAPKREATAPPVETPAPAPVKAEPPPTPRVAEPQPQPQPAAAPRPQPRVEPDAPPPRATTPDADEPPSPKKLMVKPKPLKAKPAPDADALARSLDQAIGAAPKVPARPVAEPHANPSQLAALLEKSIGSAPAWPRARPGPVASAQPANAAPDARAMATLKQSIAGQIYRCWNVPPGSQGQTVDLHILLARDGSLVAAPEVRGQAGAPNALVGRAFAESAKRAVSRCAPLRLPAALYDQWRDIDPLHFDPRDIG